MARDAVFPEGSESRGLDAALGVVRQVMTQLRRIGSTRADGTMSREQIGEQTAIALDRLKGVERILTTLGDQVARGVHTNPGGWREVQMSDGVEELRYQHVEDGELYKHGFGDDVQMFAVQQGKRKGVLLLHRRGLPLWKDF